LRVSSTRLQNGHWKSLKTSITTLAFSPPFQGLSGAGASTVFFSGGGGSLPSLISSL